MKSHYLFPGKLAAFKEETVISTLLGSCVAVALHDPVAKVGGLNHYLLPEAPDGDVPNPRYGNYAIPELINEVERVGGDRKRMEAKIYGGANVINAAKTGLNIGDRNIELAKRLLSASGIRILEQHVAGEQARTIKFNTATSKIILNVGGEAAEGEVVSSRPAVDISGFRPLAAAKNVKVLVVDDSATVRNLFTSIFTKNGLEVVGAAADPYQARDLIAQKKPDVLTLDIEMPKMSGVMFLEKLMKHHPIPVVMVSSLGSTGDAAMKSLELGAIEFVHKPSQFDPSVLKDLAETLVEKVKAAASVNILKKLKEAPKPVVDVDTGCEISNPKKRRPEPKVVVVGGNAGSADSIATFIKSLAQDTPPVVIACSTITNFLMPFIDKIKSQTKVSLSIAKDGEFLRMGGVYFIPAGLHGKVMSNSTGATIKLEKGAPVASQIPSANVLFESAVNAFGGGVYGIVFGGFGVDGVDGLTKIQGKGGGSVVQHPDQAQFPYAPQKAIEMGVADEILKAESMAKHLMDYRNQSVM